MRQGRDPELTGRHVGMVVRRRQASVRTGLEEAVDAWRWRTRVKCRKASLVGELARGSDALFLLVPGRIGDVIAAKSQRLTPGDLPGSGRVAGRPKNERTTADDRAEVGGSRITGWR